MKSIGLCIGASTLTMVELEKRKPNPEIQRIISRPHEGNPREALNTTLHEAKIFNGAPISITGRRFKDFVNLPSISEPQAIEYALAHITNGTNPYQAVISVGGETFIVYKLDNQGRITRVYTGNKCASGTGEFFLQQIRRLDLSIQEASRLGFSEEPHHVSGRCSVFCKSDCTHATNIGVPKGQVVAGLSQMMAEKVLELLKTIPHRDILLIGGVTRLSALTEYLRANIENLTIPKEATYFEALGCALWGLESGTATKSDFTSLYLSGKSQFDFHKPLKDFQDQVTFAKADRGTVRENDSCILGLDVGSTTTKAVLLRESDNKILASEYLRTNGNPVAASRECYAAILNQLNGTKVVIRGLGATGSGRKIAGLHALTDGTINEIIAHAEAALYFDKEVDTIFEIGGQDAKYTYLTNGVASDYAMNEACSAGTGSFLEEAAKESLGIEMEDIADWAMKGTMPPNFNDQCAAFISSDIKNTHHEGILREDIVAGLVYSICLNYVNRVKGARPTGQKVFMQGGVCYNRAVPIAMAALSGKQIIVPPEPGLMGAFGVALEVKNRLNLGLLKEDRFDLQMLAARDVTYKDPFVCTGGGQKCDLGCSVNRIVIEKKTYPFGGACNLYYNLRNKIKVDLESHDLVTQRYELVYEHFAPSLEMLSDSAPTVGLSKSLLMNTFYPLFAHFLVNLGFRPVLPDSVDEKGSERCMAAFCYPCEISHGYFRDLLGKSPDYILVPHIKGVHVEPNTGPSRTCPLVQGEPYYLKQTFEKELENGPVYLAPVIDLADSKKERVRQFIGLAEHLGANRKNAEIAYEKAAAVQVQLQQEMRRRGRKAIQELEVDPDRTGVILFGRPYNAFVPEGNKGIPHKFASRGITVIPVDFLELDQIPGKEHMYWSMGQMNLKGARVVLDHPQLFGTFITNFSCGPDSFVIGYFRDIMGTKPSLTLELDNHTADAGLETRIEAFLDIVHRYRNLNRKKAAVKHIKNGYQPATSALTDGTYKIRTSGGETIDFFDPRVKMVFASMGRHPSSALSAAFQSQGIRTRSLPMMTEMDLKVGRGNSSCKECLPLQLTTGALIKYLLEEREPDEITVYFVPTANGPCRFGQYQDFMRGLVEKQQIRDVTFFSMADSDGYGGLGTAMTLRLWKAIVIADVFEDIYNSMMVLAEDPENALKTLERVWQLVLEELRQKKYNLKKALSKAAHILREVPAKIPLREAPQVLLVGEIYVRKEGLSRRWLPERLAENGIVTHVAPVHEWVHYVDWLYDHHLLDATYGPIITMTHNLKKRAKAKSEKEIKKIMADSDWFIPRIIDVDHVVKTGEHFISRQLTGEAIITVGGPIAEVGQEFCGSIAVGPFGCMPNRLSESILNVVMDRKHVLPIRPDAFTEAVTRNNPDLPFLAIESDGNPFPQIIEARLETFAIQALRMFDAMKQKSNGR